MKNRSLVRKLMMVAGLMAALTILFSPAFKHETSRPITEASTASDETKDDCAKLVAVSADAVTSSQAVQVESVNPYVVQEIITESEHPASTTAKLLSLPFALITSLLKTVISPQAP
jgi:hypothetical protein